MDFILALAGEASSRQREELMGAVGGTAAPGGQRELPDPALWLHSLPLSACRPCLGDTGSVLDAALL